MSRKIKRGTDAMNMVYASIGRLLNETSAGKELLIKNAHIQELTFNICKDLGLICQVEGNYLTGCTRPPRARGLCTKHFNQKYHKYGNVYNSITTS